MFNSLTNSIRQLFSPSYQAHDASLQRQVQVDTKHDSSTKDHVTRVLAQSPHERGLSRDERSVASVLPWMRSCVRIFIDPEMTITNQRRVSLGIAREIADGGRASRYAFFESIYLEGKDRTATWGTLLQVAAAVYHDFMSGLKEPYTGSNNPQEKIKYLRRNINLGAAPFESRFVYIDNFQDLYRAVSPNFLCRGHASALRGLMCTIKDNRNSKWADAFFAPGPRVLDISPDEVGVQTGPHLFLFPGTHRDEVQCTIKELDACLSINHSAECICDSIRFACQKPRTGEELTRLLAQELGYKPDNSTLSRLLLLSRLSLGSPSGDDLALHRVDRAVAPNAEDAEDYVRMVTHPMRLLIEEELSIKLGKIPLQEQFYLLDLLRSHTQDSLQQLSEPLKLLGEQAARAFIVCEYNKNHANTLERWMRCTDPNVSRAQIGLLCNCLDSLWSFSTELKQHVKNSGASVICENAPKEITEALLRRTVDLFIASINTDLTQSAGITCEQIDDALRGLNTLLSVLGDVSSQNRYTLTRLDPNGLQSSPESLIFSIFDSSNGGTMKLKMLFRPRTNDAGEARWNMELCFPKDFPDKGIYDAFLHTTRHARSGQQTTASVLRVGFDFDMSGDTPRISLDVGRSPFAGQNYQCNGCIIGRILSRVTVDGSGHHTTHSFPTDLAQPEEFAQAVNLMRSYFPPDGTVPREARH